MNNKAFIQHYLQTLSGRPKPSSTVEQFVTDASLAQHIEAVEAAFPEYEIIAEELVAEGDLVAVRGTFRGRHGGAFAGIAPTGKTVSGPLMIMYRVSEGRIAEHWLEFNTERLIEQLRN
jgi:predicted ester cyclase